ncbi:DUF397 domain-containing protein [Streptomyces smyrnaeus]|uniref:DUF397 domain-containing protein n=1 Tax=Streptomyces smyrnaeus TaxID=1387713 RepID=UPI0033EF75CF
MTRTTDLSAVVWRKSSYSGQNGGDCLEVGVDHPGAELPVRDSKNPHGPALLVAPHAWQAFITQLKALTHD